MTEVSSGRGYPVTVNCTINGATLRTASRSGSNGLIFAGPKDEAVQLSRAERNPVGVAPVRVDHFAPSGFQPATGPARVKSWNISPIACRDDHSGRLRNAHRRGA